MSLSMRFDPDKRDLPIPSEVKKNVLSLSQKEKIIGILSKWAKDHLKSTTYDNTDEKKITRLDSYYSQVVAFAEMLFKKIHTKDNPHANS